TTCVSQFLMRRAMAWGLVWILAVLPAWWIAREWQALYRSSVGDLFCRQLKRGFPTRQFSILIGVANHDTKGQDTLEPRPGLLEVAHTQLDPACFSHIVSLPAYAHNCCDANTGRLHF